MLKAVIVDDERLAREKLRSMLSQYPEIEISGEGDDLESAARVISQTEPDVVFLDIQLSGESGFDLLHRIPAGVQIIFVTAYDKYAMRAFEVNALDYLLKPVRQKRLSEAIDRLHRPPELSRERESLTYEDHIFVTSEHFSQFVRISRIVCICAATPYTEVRTGDGNKILIHKSLKEWENRLPATYFIRIHRSTIVNLEYVMKVEKWFNHTHRVYMHKMKDPFMMSRRFARKLKGRL